MIGEIPISDACHYMDAHGTETGIGHDQALQGLDGGVHRFPAISLVGKGLDDKDQTAARELAWGKGPPMASTEIKVDILDGKAQSNTQWSPQRYLGISPSMRLTWHSSTPTQMLSKISRTLVHTGGGMGKHSCL